MSAPSKANNAEPSVGGGRSSPKVTQKSASAGKTASRVMNVRQAMEFFNSSVELQKMYAAHVATIFKNFADGRRSTYPHDLNTPQDIAAFAFNNRNVSLGEDTLSDTFMKMVLYPNSTFQAKRKKQEEHSLRDAALVKVSKKASPASKELAKNFKKTEAPKATAKGPTPATSNLNVRQKQPVGIAYVALNAPRFMSFFPSPREKVTMSEKGLHAVAQCQLCKEIGHFTHVDGKKKPLTLSQRFYVAMLHDLTDKDGNLAGDAEARLAICKLAPDPKATTESAPAEEAQAAPPPSKPWADEPVDMEDGFE